MIRGTTPTISYTLPFQVSELTDAELTLAQKDEVKVLKKLEHCSCDTHKLSITLTQEETLQLDCSCPAEIQLRVKVGEQVFATRPALVSVEKLLADGEVL